MHFNNSFLSYNYFSFILVTVLKRIKISLIHANLVNFTLVSGARNPGQGGEGLYAQEPLPNRLIKQQQEVDSCLYLTELYIIAAAYLCCTLGRMRVC